MVFEIFIVKKLSFSLKIKSGTISESFFINFLKELKLQIYLFDLK